MADYLVLIVTHGHILLEYHALSDGEDLIEHSMFAQQYVRCFT